MRSLRGVRCLKPGVRSAMALVRRGLLAIRTFWTMTGSGVALSRDIHATVSYGIRNEESDDARYSEMPAFGRDELLEKGEIDAVVNYVMSLSGTPEDATLVTVGAEVFADNCASCHGDTALGDRDQGAPNLADAIWLYGGDYASLKETVTNSRYGVMPNWDSRLTEAEIRAVTAYVHQLGGGE